MPTDASGPLFPPGPAGPAGRDLDHVARLVVEGHQAAPAATVAACQRTAKGWDEAAGAAGFLDPGAAPVTPSTLFDLASVTKPCTALVALRLHRAGLIDLRAPLAGYLDEARGTLSATTTLELLLSHRSGLDAHRPLYAPLLEGREVDRAAALREAAGARRPGCEGPAPGHGHPPVYSDLGYLLAGEALARAAGLGLADLVQREVAIPCGIELFAAADLAGRRGEVAPTEEVPFRGGVIRGEVHDENAWALGGAGLSGHAGLFAAAPAVARLGRALLEALAAERPGWLDPESLSILVRPRPGGTLRCGFDGRSEGGSSSGRFFGPASVGHLGFTGTSLWLDPDQGLAVALLTNRVHPTRAHDAIRRARPAAHDAVVDWARGSAVAAAT
jgi:CubicO group peptidase (beta-lactamase class C family)